MSEVDLTWNAIMAASAMTEELERRGRPETVGDLLTWSPADGWQARVALDDPRASLFDLYLPICNATRRRPITVGHLGQSLDGFIATPTGDSQFVTGDANLTHLHRMRALSGAIIVGAGTVAADNPQLTTRLVTGPNPLRVVVDSARRLAGSYRVFTDAAAPTLYVCAQSRVRAGETHVGDAAIVGVDDELPGGAMMQVLRLLHERGCARVFVEGGGVTVSAFLEANLLDRLQIAIAPLLIGDGRPAIRLAPHESLRDCMRPGYRVFRMGGDVLFDCELRSKAAARNLETVSRVI